MKFTILDCGLILTQLALAFVSGWFGLLLLELVFSELGTAHWFALVLLGASGLTLCIASVGAWMFCAAFIADEV